MENPQHIKQLYEKYLNNNFSEQELDELLEYFYNSGEHHELSEMIKSELANEKSEYQGHSAVQALLAELDRDLFVEIEKRQTPVKTVRLWPKFRIKSAMTALITAAAVVVIVSGLYFYNRHKPLMTQQTAVVNDIAPGRNGATITLANGKVIKLSDRKTGVIVGQEITYNDGAAVQGGGPDPDRSGQALRQDDVMQMTASTAKGQTYQFTLPDGTKVWLNADSKLEFPSKFLNVKTRNVKLSGEGYFEVAKDKTHPFIVKSSGQQVEVLGTHFNISAYGDDADIKTTLLEGSVKVNESTVLKPGQQAVLYDNKIKVLQTNTEDIIAWKNGLFVFEDEPLQSVMRKVARWYDVEVRYDQNVNRKELYWGSVSRYDKISKVLEGLELTKGIHFKIEGRRITVMR